MRPQINVVTLGVGNLKKSLTFYRDGLGLPTEGIIGTEFEGGAVVFFHMNNGSILALYPKAELAKDAKVPVAESSCAEFSIGHNVSTKAEVDAVMKQAEKAGATITDPAHDRVWGGYSGYFADPDGHLWEVVYNPHWKLDEQGNVTV